MGVSFLPEGRSINKPPVFNGKNFSYWKKMIKLFFDATDLYIWDVIEKGDYVPTKTTNEGSTVPKTETELDEKERRLVLLNHKAKLLLKSALRTQEYSRVSNCATAKDMWDALEISHELTGVEKENRLRTLTREYELFRMKEGESIRDLQLRFSIIVYHLSDLGKTYPQGDQVQKILNSLTMEWWPKVTAIEEVKGESMSSLAALFGSLAAHEVRLKARSVAQQETTKRLNLQLLDEDDESEIDDEDVEFITMFNKFLKQEQRGRRFQRKENNSTSKKEGKGPLICYKCKKPGHIKWDCPHLVKKQRKDKKEKGGKKAYISSIWGKSSDEES